LKRNNILKRKLAQAKKLARNAIKDSPKWKPAQGYKYIKDIRIGELIETQSRTRAVLIDVSDVSAAVLVTAVNHVSEKDKAFYLGKHRWASQSEVKLV
jgi:hypothetical protein